MSGWLADALGFPIVALGRYLAGEAPAASDPTADALRTKPGKSAAVSLIGTPAAPVTLGASLNVTRSLTLDVRNAKYVSWFLQLRTNAAGTTAAQIGFSMEASPDGLSDWYPVPLLYVNATPTPATIFPTDPGTGAAPDGIGFSDANNTYQRYAMYDVLVRPLAGITGASISVKFAIPAFVHPYNYVRGVMIPLFTGGSNPTGSLVATTAS